MRAFLQKLEEALEQPDLPEKDQWGSGEEEVTHLFVASGKDAEDITGKLTIYINTFNPEHFRIEHLRTIKDQNDTLGGTRRIWAWIRSKLNQGNYVDYFKVYTDEQACVDMTELGPNTDPDLPQVEKFGDIEIYHGAY